MSALLIGLLGFVIGGGVLYAIGLSQRRDEGAKAASARIEAEELLTEAKNKSELLIKEAEVAAKKTLVEAREQAEREVRELRKDVTALENKLEAREESFEKRLEAFERREADFNRRDQAMRNREKALADKEAERDALIDEARRRLESVAGLTRDEAKGVLMNEMIESARHDAAKHIRVVEEEAR